MKLNKEYRQFLKDTGIKSVMGTDKDAIYPAFIAVTGLVLAFVCAVVVSYR